MSTIYQKRAWLKNYGSAVTPGFMQALKFKREQKQLSVEASKGKTGKYQWAWASILVFSNTKSEARVRICEIAKLDHIPIGLKVLKTGVEMRPDGTIDTSKTVFITDDPIKSKPAMTDTEVAAIYNWYKK